MAAFMRACVCRFVNFRPQIANLKSVSRNVKCIQSVFPQQILSRQCSNVASYSQDQDKIYRVKVTTHDDPHLKGLVAANFIGKGGRKIREFTVDCDIDVNDNNLWISGKDADIVEQTVERVTTEVQRIRNDILPIYKIVSIDADKDYHNMICAQLIGKQGQNIKRLLLGAEQNVDVKIPSLDKGGPSAIVVTGTEEEAVNTIVAKIQEDIQRIKNETKYSEKVFTGMDKDSLEAMCGKIIGKGGVNMKRICSELGFDFNIRTNEGHILISATDTESVKKAVEWVQREIERIRNEDAQPFYEKLLTDEDESLHDRICGMVIGRRGENLNRLRSETGLNFEVKTFAGHIVVSGFNASELKKVAEKLQENIQKTKNEMYYSDKVLTSTDDRIHETICAQIIGKGGENLKRLHLELGSDFSFRTSEGRITISAPDSDSVKKAIEKVQQEIHRIKAVISTLTREVSTDEDKEIHERICGKVVGKGGENLKKLCLDVGFEFYLKFGEGHIIVSGSNDEEVQRATEKVQQEVQRIRNEDAQLFYEKFVTDEDPSMHNRICGMIIGRRGENLNRLRSETGINFELKTRPGYIVISGADAEKVKLVAEKIQEEIEVLRNENSESLGVKVWTDNNILVHRKMCAMLIGKGRMNLSRLSLETGMELNVKISKQNAGFILVSGSDAEGTKKAVERVQQEIKEIRDKYLACVEKVFTDENREIHDKICGRIVGKGGENIRKIKSETNLDFDLILPAIDDNIDFLLISGTDAEVVREAKGKVQQEIENIKGLLTL